MQLTFVTLKESHLDLMHSWLNQPHVSEWWGKDGENGCTIEAIRDKYLPRIADDSTCEGYICFNGSEPLGYIQAHRLVDYPEYVDQLGVAIDDTIAGCDLFIGDANNLHKGFGTAMLKQFLRQIVFGEMKALACTVGPVQENVNSIKAYAKVGFKHWTTAEVKDSGTEYLMKIEPADLVADA